MNTRLNRVLASARASARSFDTAIETRLDRHRGNPVLDRAMYTASELGDFSLVWHLLSTARGLAPDRRPEDVVRVAALLGTESLLVNQGIKRLFNRTRPDFLHADHPHQLRRPRTSSFPSGHASSAALAVVVLADRDPLWPLYAGIGALVASSRVYVKVHHPSDVVAGAAVGLALGIAARKLWPRR
jgi:membrane-associated phospholipid phosphatase